MLRPNPLRVGVILLLVLCFLSRAQAQKLLPRKVRAPALVGGKWLNTKAPLTLEDLRGKFVVLDFWTYCCINCKHILPVLKELEHKYDKNIVVIGVHSPKFANEQEDANVQEAIVRYDIEHPVLTDPKLALWRKYQVDVWPSLRIIDPEGQVIAVHEGEIHFETLDRFFSRQIAAYRRRSKLDETPVRFDLERGQSEPSALLYPGKVLATERRLFIADSSNHRIVVSSLAGKLESVIGDGEPGDRGGGYSECRFRDPQGMALDGETLYVADTENHKIRAIDLTKKQVRTIAGTGVKRDRAASKAMAARSAQLASPWDVMLHGQELLIAMAGTHQIWRMNLSSGQMRVVGGNGTEDIIDGAGVPRGAYVSGTSSFAQPSGLATDGVRLLIADSEGSSIRYMPLEGGNVGTLVGTARLKSKRLFTFGDRDGAATQALLQHPIGVAWHEGKVLVADTYNNKIRAIDVKSGRVSTLLGDGTPGDSDDPVRLDEPAGVSVLGGKLYVADTNNHAIRVYDFATQRCETLTIEGLEPPATLPWSFNGPSLGAGAPAVIPEAGARVVDGHLQIAMSISLPATGKLNDDAPARVRIRWPDANPLRVKDVSQVVTASSRDGKLLLAKVPVGAASGEADVTIKLDYFYCNQGENKFCRPAAAEWKGRLRVGPQRPTYILLK